MGDHAICSLDYDSVTILMGTISRATNISSGCLERPQNFDWSNTLSYAIL